MSIQSCELKMDSSRFHVRWIRSNAGPMYIRVHSMLVGWLFRVVQRCCIYVDGSMFGLRKHGWTHGWKDAFAVRCNDGLLIWWIRDGCTDWCIGGCWWIVVLLVGLLDIRIDRLFDALVIVVPDVMLNIHEVWMSIASRDNESVSNNLIVIRSESCNVARKRVGQVRTNVACLKFESCISSGRAIIPWSYWFEH